MPTQLAACTIEPAGGMLLATDRAEPRVLVGRAGIVVTHARATRLPGVERLGVTTATFPLGADPPETLPVIMPRGSGIDVIVPLRFGAEAGYVACTRRAQVGGPRGAVVPTLTTNAHPTRSDNRYVFAALGTTVYGVRASRDGMVGYVGRLGAPSVEGSLGSTRGLDAEWPYLAIDATDEAVLVRWGRARARTVYEVEMGGDGTRLGEVRVVPTPVAAEPEYVLTLGFADDEMRRHHTPQHLRFARPGERPRPVIGLDEAAFTGSPSVAVNEERAILAWTEGLEDSVIRAARFDTTAGTIVGPVTRISNVDRWARPAHVDTHSDHMVVAWSEDNGRTSEIRAAELRCP